VQTWHRSNTPRRADDVAADHAGKLRAGLAAAGVIALTFGSAPAFASEVETAAEAQPGPAAIDLFTTSDFDAATGLPSAISSAGRSTRAPEDELQAPVAAIAPALMIAQPKLGPLTMEQPVRVYTNDVTVKFKAPGGNSTFATFELIF